MGIKASALEKPLPRPRQDPLGYARARVLEALLEALLALRFLEEGYTRNAAGKAFQAWRALTSALLTLKRDEVLRKLGDREQREWFIRKAIPRTPSSRLKALGQLLEEIGYHDYTLHQHGAKSPRLPAPWPDLDAELSKYASSEEAARDIVSLVEKLIEIIEKYVKPLLKQYDAWSRDNAEALEMIKERLRRKRGRRES